MNISLVLRRILLFSLFGVLVIGGCVASKAEYQLYRDLLANYSRLVRPVRNSSEPLKISMMVYLQQIIGVVRQHDEKNQVIELNAWLNADETFDSTYKSSVVVYSNGQINWIPPGIFRASCSIDITWFPFDDQSCYLKFGSWTYNGFAIDLQIDSEPGTDTPAVREETFYVCCPEPYPTIKFYINLRRRTLFHGFNLIIPSLVISVMTLLAFSLPPHDMSEKIGFQTTILLSVCFFLTIVSDMTPPTSEAVPLLGVFFSTLTLIVAVSTTFTITVLNLRYRQSANCEMSATFRNIFLKWLPQLLIMSRPGRKHIYRKRLRKDNFIDSSQCLQCVGVDTVEEDTFATDGSMMELTRMGPSALARKLCTIPCEKLDLQRKIGEGIFAMRRYTRARLRKATQCDKYIKKCLELLSDPQSDAYDENVLIVVKYYSVVYERLKYINERMRQKEERNDIEEDWKYASMVLDRFCFYIFSTFFIVSITAIFLSPPYINV
uniref:Neur_chan_LBD domain-containing protein n=2 Tax=Ascaris TaxID=6251 RepID=A0A0M3HZ62_ASCLU